MKMTTECVYCIFKQMDRNYLNLEKNPEKRVAFMRKVCLAIGQSDKNSSAPLINASLMAIIAKEAGKKDLYEEEKRTYNQAVLKMEDDIKKRIMIATDKLYRALQYAMTGNYIDFGNLSGVSEDKLHELIESAPNIDLGETYGKLKAQLENAKSLVYLLDNCGEVVFDKICMEFIKELYPNLKITAVVRGYPIYNDVTMTDARQAGLLDIVSVIGNGSAIPGTVLEEISKEAKTCIDEADIIISKGMGNYETLEGCGLNVYFLLLCKCERFMIKFSKPHLGSVFCRERE